MAARTDRPPLVISNHLGRLFYPPINKSPAISVLSYFGYLYKYLRPCLSSLFSIFPNLIPLGFTWSTCLVLFLFFTEKQDLGIACVYVLHV